MSNTPSKIQIGTVLAALLPSEFGDDWKIRPAIAISPVSDKGMMVVVVCTTKLDPTDTDKVEIPSGVPGVSTGLLRATAANCRWIHAIHVEDVRRICGHVSQGLASAIRLKAIQVIAKRKKRDQ
jgi:mRNA-degrading endonuclease toxin of MazEF toxin-antitoxin module